MASITITIPDAIAQRVLNGFCSHYGYLSTLENGNPNPETKLQFAKRKIIEYIKAGVEVTEVQAARNSAATTAKASIDLDIVLT